VDDGAHVSPFIAIPPARRARVLLALAVMLGSPPETLLATGNNVALRRFSTSTPEFDNAHPESGRCREETLGIDTFSQVNG